MTPSGIERATFLFVARHLNHCATMVPNHRVEFLSVKPFGRLQKIWPASFREICQWLEFPLNGLRAQSRVSPAVGLLPLASGPACLGMAFPPLLVKQLYRCDSVVISSFVRTGYTTRR